MLACAALPSAADDYSQWSYSQDVVFNTRASGAAVSATVKDFPVLIRLTSANAGDVFAQGSGNGRDLRFANREGKHLPYQIERWNAEDRKAEIWVLADSVKGSDSAAALRMYWGRADAADSSNPARVFTAANGFVSVWHLGNAASAGGRPNAVQGGPPATPTHFPGGYGAKPGIIGLADTLRGGTWLAGDYLALGDSAAGYPGFSDFTAGFTFSVWAYPTSVTPYSKFFELGGPFKTSTNIFFIRRNNTPHVSFGYWNGATEISIYGGNNGYVLANPGDTIALDTWQQLTAVKDAVGIKLYKDGLLFASKTSDLVLANPMPVVARKSNYLGRAVDALAVPANSNCYQGKFDEVVLSKVARSPDWIRLGHQNQRADQKLVTLGAKSPPTRTASPHSPSRVLVLAVPGRGPVSFPLPDGEIGWIRFACLDVRGRTHWDRTLRIGPGPEGLEAVSWGRIAPPGRDPNPRMGVLRMTVLDRNRDPLGVRESRLGLSY